MALITCSDCGKNISDQASACIHCGKPITTNSEYLQAQGKNTNQSAKPTTKPDNRGLFIFLVAAGALFYFLSSITSDDDTKNELPTAEVQASAPSLTRGQSINKYKSYERSALCSVAYEHQARADMADYVINKSTEKDKSIVYAIGAKNEFKKSHPSERDGLAATIISSLDCSAL